MPQTSRQALDALLREHQYISSSLLDNRQKGAIRFNLYIAIVGIAFLLFGMKEKGVFDAPALAVVGGFGFIIVFGWLILITLIRRSITTDLHLIALSKIRDYFKNCFGGGGNNDPFNKALPEREKSFEKIKARYYKGPAADDQEATCDVNVWYLVKHLGMTFPHYGDLIENICSINSLVIALFAAWTISYANSSQVHISAIVVVFASALAWTWYTQIMYAWYKHSTDKSILDDKETDISDVRQYFKTAVLKISGCSLAVLILLNYALIVLTSCWVSA